MRWLIRKFTHKNKSGEDTGRTQSERMRIETLGDSFQAFINISTINNNYQIISKLNK